ncbi:hypothetical protein F4809DRAFT_360956 [Biscogniauxia mediterranea]|nr:hypothetical protein F4809DRAFT_360956 [Biscogniauxia mediterranea]
MPSIRGQNILVIGGSSGIGAAVAKLAAEEGVHVSIASSNAARVQKAIASIQAAVPGVQIAGYTCDVNHDDVESNLEQLFADVTLAANSLLDHVIYTAMSLDIKPVTEVSAGYLRSSVQFGYVVPFLIAKLATRYMKPNHSSSITFTTGRLAEKPMHGAAVVSGCASSLYGTTRGLALDLAPIRVNLVSPGVTDTGLLGSGEKRAQRVEVMAKESVLGKIASPEEVAEAYVYLMKDTNTTGTCVRTNGGVLLK